MQQLFEINNKVLSKPIIIYGAGNTGLDCFVELMNRDIRVEAFCDSDSSKWGIKLMNKNVISPEELSRKINGYNVIIASQFHREISGKLRKWGG